jgi:prophage antirepressor-like protein
MLHEITLSADRIPTTFDFGDEGIPVRVAIDDNGDPLFCAGDVCRAIGLANVSQALSRLEDDEKANITTSDAIGRPHRMLAVTESGMFALVLTSRQDRARDFRRWVTSDVLPSIRRRGRYDITQGDREIEDKLDADPTTKTLRALIDVRRDQLVLERQQRELVAAVVETQAIADEAKKLAQATAETVAGRTGHVSALGYANIQGYKIRRDRLAVLGRRMGKVARERGIVLPDTGDERFGGVKIYPESFIREFDSDFRREAGLAG